LYWNCGSVCILLNWTRVYTLFSLLNIQVWFLKKKLSPILSCSHSRSHARTRSAPSIYR
jgi:hypothetical protein